MRLRKPASLLRVAASGTISLALLATSLGAPVQTVGAATLPSLSLTGHGYGHGRGMGQYGAYGYALLDWNDTQILSHFYGGTTTSRVSPTETIHVRLSEFDTSASISPGKGPSGDTIVSEYGTTRYYQGSVAVVNGAVLNTVPLDDYVEGVVPAESPASWGVQGIAALEAQAVAARSYALAYIAAEGSICDSTACQVYEGDPSAPGSPTNSGYISYSDQAVNATSGQVLVCQASTCGTPGSVALTEYSSSTGGYSAGGAFPAVPDAGDSVAGAYNPNHTWTATVPAATVEAAYPSIGTLTGASVTTRNGLGDLGGRVLTMTISGTAGSVSTTGTGFAAAVGLRSDWFTFTSGGSGGSGSPGTSSLPTVSGGDNGYWVVGSDGTVFDFGGAPNLGSMAGQHLNGSVLAMAPTADQNGYWLVGTDGGVFSFGDARFFGSTGNLVLNKPVVGMAATPDGGGYWLVASDGGVFSFGDARFFGSTGNLVLNKPIVGMAATPDGGGYWLVASDGGIFAFGDARFYGSTGNLVLDQPVVGMVPTADGHGYTLVARDGGVFSYGDAAFEGSLPGAGISATVTGVSPTADGRGYLEVTAAGGVYVFGDAPYDGSILTEDPGWGGEALGIFAHKGS